MTSDVLSQRAINRALLARQHLLRRWDSEPLAVVRQLVGLQAQAPTPPYFALWSRLARFDPDDLSRLILDRVVVRIALMRGTVYLVDAGDSLTLRPLLRSTMERALRNTTYAPRLDGIDLPALATAGRALLEDKPRTTADAGTLLARRWPDRDPAALAFALRALLPLVQTPPRGIWGAGGSPVCTTVEAWLGRPLDPAPSIEDVVLRYLAGFGPASVADAQAWAGMTRLRPVFERLRPRLRTFRDERGRELFDLPDAPRPDPETPAPVRFVAPFDDLLLSHADRTRVISDEHRRVVFTQNGIVQATILVDGMVRGLWRTARQRDAATLTVTPFRALSTTDIEALTAEGLRLLRFAEPDAARHDVVFTGQ
ncbi:winged helix DNA-binding domain-containing protein [Rugosimonospora africana]|uniref:Winged helix DNA-binding domain-containing protein n=1 Tax=Rugosimonospora africana TaxID=556532 RepID=A0A8J3QMZ7_9ACTN|nr:winged helix DNA-binding domain-containing protein [Rugosimonospora africana]GIH12947.1 hypothetical protein Raf01_11190 [Rugosimonospora africana]